MSVSSFGRAEWVWVEKLGSRGSSRWGEGSGSAPRSLYTGSRPGFEVQQACGSAGDREMRLFKWVDGTDQKSGAGVKAVWRRSSDAFWSSRLCVVVG